MTAVKGTAIASVVEDVNRLLDAGRLREEELEARLPAPDLDILKRKVQAASWYPLDTYGRLSDLLCEAEGRGDPEYLVERGRRAAERIRGSGVYAQLDADPERWGDRIGAIMASLGPAMFRDTRWTFQAQPEPQDKALRFRVIAEVQRDFPEAGRFAIQGFIDALSRSGLAGRTRIVSRRRLASRLEFDGRSD